MSPAALAASSTPPATRPAPLRRAGTLTAALLAAMLLGVGTAPAALAHDTLTDSSPEDGAELDASPEEVELTFSNDIGDGANAIVVTGPDGETYEDGETEIDGPDAAVALHELPEAGEYTVSYRMISADGHALEDELAFSITEEAVPEPTPDSEESSSAQDEETADDPGAEESPEEQTAADPMSSLGPVGAIIGAIAVIALIAILLIRMRNRPGGNRPGNDAADND